MSLRTASEWSQTLGRDTKDTRAILKHMGSREWYLYMIDRTGRSRNGEQGLVRDKALEYMGMTKYGGVNCSR